MIIQVWSARISVAVLRDILRLCLFGVFGSFSVLAATSCTTNPPEQVFPYEPGDAELKVVLIDQVPQESLIGLCLDTAGRIFVGGRERLFVYEPNVSGGYHPRQEIYRFPSESWVFDVAVRGHDLYVATASAVYLIRDGAVKRQGLEPVRIVWGQPLGHIQLGFHGLAWGPEGDLYITMGDALQHYGDFARADHWGHWTLFSGPEATPTPYTGVGAVLRCRPDGSRLQVYSTGSFNHFGLAFDSQWNLFSNDNDREAMPSRYAPARLLHVTRNSYFGWPRGWMPEKDPDRADLLETVYPGLGRDAPVDVAYYNETFLPERFRDNLLLSRWVQRLVSRHPLEPHGASYQADEETFLLGKDVSRPLGLAVGRGGRVFLTIGQMEHLEGSPLYDADLVMITSIDDPSDHPFDGYDAASVDAEKLWEELSNPSWHRRYNAHIEILRRGSNLHQEAIERLLNLSRDDPAVFHLPWIAGADGSAQASRVLHEWSLDEDERLRIQVLKVLSEFPRLEATEGVFIRALSDPDSRVQHVALTALFDFEGPVPESVVTGPARSSDSYLRQPATLLLAKRATLFFLEELSRSDDARTRLAAVLATGFRLTLPDPTAKLSPELPLDPFPESANVIEYADATVDLTTLGRTGKFTIAEHWNAGSRTPEQEQLFRLLVRMVDDRNEPVRRQSAYFLSLLNDPRSEPIVARVVKELDQNRLEGAPLSFLKAVPESWAVGPFDDGSKGFDTPHDPELRPVDLAEVYSTGVSELSWKRVEGGYLDFGKTLGSMDSASYYGYFVLESGTAQTIMFFVGSNDGVKVWHNGNLVWENDVERPAVVYNDMVTLQLQPGSNHFLIRVQNRTGDSGLYVNYKALEPVAVHLPEKMEGNLLAERVADGRESTSSTDLPEAFQEVNWERLATQGNAERGQELFESLACGRCHSLTSESVASVGPSLAGAGKRFSTIQLAESILLPSRRVSPLFRQTRLKTRSGEEVSGLVVAETADQIVLVVPDTSRKTIAKEEVIDRKTTELSPMPDGLIATPQELSDIVAYLLEFRD